VKDAKLSRRSLIGGAACFALLVFVGRTAVADSSTSADVLKKAGIKGGLVVHVGCGDGKFTAALHASDSYIVQGLTTDSDAVTAARESLAESGDVTIGLFDGKALPYADNLVQLVVADSDSQVATAEIMRVLSPGGVVMTRTSGGWNRVVKDWPDDIDQSDALTGVVAADPETGRILWKHEEEQYNPMSMAVSGKHLVYHNHKQIICLRSDDGRELWKVATQKLRGYSRVNGPSTVIADQRVVISGTSGLLALNKQRGETEWTKTPPVVVR